MPVLNDKDNYLTMMTQKTMLSIKKLRKNGFLTGMGSVLNIFPAHNTLSSDIHVDTEQSSLQADWKLIGRDFETAISKLIK